MIRSDARAALGLLVVLVIGAGCSTVTSDASNLGTTGGPSSAVPSTTVEPSAEESPEETSPGATGQASEPTAPPSEAAGSPVPLPSGSGLPTITSFKAPHTASCSSDNGTGTPGDIKLTWQASDTTGVRISIDPPSPDTAYDNGYADYGVSGSADVPFACGAPNHDATGAYHLYVVTTLHDKGYAFYRYAKVYETTSPSPTP